MLAIKSKQSSDGKGTVPVTSFVLQIFTNVIFWSLKKWESKPRTSVCSSCGNYTGWSKHTLV